MVNPLLHQHGFLFDDRIERIEVIIVDGVPFDGRPLCQVPDFDEMVHLPFVVKVPKLSEDALERALGKPIELQVPLVKRIEDPLLTVNDVLGTCEPILELLKDDGL